MKYTLKKKSEAADGNAKIANIYSLLETIMILILVKIELTSGHPSSNGSSISSSWNVFGFSHTKPMLSLSHRTSLHKPVCTQENKWNEIYEDRTVQNKHVELLLKTYSLK